ncbi:hypothetical protein KJ708_05015, partial [bacterium]|nr:hypothetical protein [bacterium]
GKLLVYNPSFEFLNIMIRECVSPKSHNPMMWLLKNIPKRTMTRDARRYFGSYILMTFKQYLLGKFSPHNEWDAQLIGAFDALDREWAHSHAARALAQDEETREDVAMQAELLAEEALRLSTDGHDHYRELKKLGYQFSSFEEFKEKYQVLKNLFNVFVKCINRNLPSREAQQDTALAFIEFCRIMSNFATLLPELEIDVLLSQLQIMKKERGQKEFLLAADIRAFTEQLKQIALERFFEKSSLSEKTQQTIRSAISDPNNPLSDIRLLNQIIAYHGFQTEKGQQAVEELLESLTVEQKRKKGIRPDQADVKVSYTENYLPEQYLEILNSLFEHLGVSSVSEISQADLQDIIDEIETALRKGEAIDAYEVKAWKDAILSLKDKLIRYNIDEVLFDLDKLIAISEQPVERTVKDYNFFITGDLISVLKAGEEPQRTCQRISSAGAYNSNGQPVYRALHPHVSMAGLKDPVTGKIVARVILEYVEPGIVLVERHYLGSHVTRMQFDQLLLTMLSKNRNIKSVVFADNPIIGEGSKHVVSVGKLPEDYYRDTYRSDRDYMAVNIKDYRIKAQIMGRWGFEV